MMHDIKRICEEPTAEDRDWFPDIAGNGDWRGTLMDAWANYRDESFILQYLSPALMRKFRLFQLSDEANESTARSVPSTTSVAMRRRAGLAAVTIRARTSRISRSSMSTSWAIASFDCGTL